MSDNSKPEGQAKATNVTAQSSSSNSNRTQKPKVDPLKTVSYVQDGADSQDR